MKHERAIGVYLVTDAALCGSHGVLATVRDAVRGGVRSVQLRDKTASASKLLALTAQLARFAGEDARIIVNDRVDVYLAARLRGIPVSGVHVGESDLPPIEVRKLVGPDAIVGLTANTAAAVAAASALPTGTIDYLGIGVIHASVTKLDHPPVMGVEGFARLAASTDLPCVAIGGVTVTDIAPLRQSGAAGVAVASAICASTDPCTAAHTLVQAWADAAP